MFLGDILGWWYGAGLKDLVKCFKKTFESTNDFFSVGLLFKSLFQPFRQTLTDIQYKRTLGQKIGDALVSRAVGFIVRGSLIFIGGLAVLFEIIILCLAVVAWPFLPLVPFGLIFLGILGVGS